MSTRWQIIAKTSEGNYGCIYVHCDGYPSYALKMLVDNYTDQAKIDRLIALGDCISVEANPNICDTFFDKGESWDDVKPTYDKNPRVAAKTHMHGDEEYAYRWNGEKWRKIFGGK